MILHYYPPYLQDNDVQVAKALIAFDAKINAVSVDSKTPLDIVLEHPAGGSSDELEILLLLLGALRYREMSTSDGAGDGVQNGNGTATNTVAEMEDDVFTTEICSEQEHAERRQPDRGDLRKLECHEGNGRPSRSPLSSPMRQKVAPPLPTLPEGQ